MSEDTYESREDRRQRIIDRIIADRQALRGEKTPDPEPENQNTIFETPAGMSVDLNKIALDEIYNNEIEMPDAVSERKWRQIGFGTEGETMAPPPADE